MIFKTTVLFLVFIFLQTIITTTNANDAEIDPVIDQDPTEKEHNKRTLGLLGAHNYDNYGWAKHVKLRGHQKLLLGYSPVDLKYVPVIKQWRFRPKQRLPQRLPGLPMHPRPDTQGWKPMVPVHVPPPSYGVPNKPWQTQNQGWSKPVTVLKPIRPSAPDHHHIEPAPHLHHVHFEEPEPHHHHQHVDYVPVNVPAVPTVQVPHPQVIYYTPNHFLQVTKPDLPVLPLGATFPVPVGPAPAPFSTVPTVPHPQVHLPIPTYVHHQHQEVHSHPQYYVPQVQVLPEPHYDFVPRVPEVVHEIPAPQFHPTQVTHYHNDYPQVDYYNAHAPQVHEHVNEHHLDDPVPVPVPVSVPVAATPVGPQPQSVEYHGHIAHLINQGHVHNAHQYVPENYNPHILPGLTGTLSPGFINPGQTDVQIPEYLPEHPNFAPTEETYYHGLGHHHQHQGLLPEGIVQPAFALEPPINK